MKKIIKNSIFIAGFLALSGLFFGPAANAQAYGGFGGYMNSGFGGGFGYGGYGGGGYGGNYNYGHSYPCCQPVYQPVHYVPAPVVTYHYPMYGSYVSYPYYSYQYQYSYPYGYGYRW